jgi:ABC-type Fe3+-citrate transport system substrate-binding protein
VSHQFVEDFRKQLSTVDSSVNQPATVAGSTRKGADGKERKAPAKRKVSDTAGETSGTSGLGEVGTTREPGHAPVPGPSADAQLVAALGITPDEVLGEMLRAVAIETEEALAISNPEWILMLADAHQRAADTLREKAGSM